MIDRYVCDLLNWSGLVRGGLAARRFGGDLLNWVFFAPFVYPHLGDLLFRECRQGVVKVSRVSAKIQLPKMYSGSYYLGVLDFGDTPDTRYTFPFLSFLLFFSL